MLIEILTLRSGAGQEHFNILFVFWGGGGLYMCVYKALGCLKYKSMG